MLMQECDEFPRGGDQSKPSHVLAQFVWFFDRQVPNMEFFLKLRLASFQTRQSLYDFLTILSSQKSIVPKKGRWYFFPENFHSSIFVLGIIY